MTSVQELLQQAATAAELAGAEAAVATHAARAICGVSAAASSASSNVAVASRAAEKLLVATQAIGVAQEAATKHAATAHAREAQSAAQRALSEAAGAMRKVHVAELSMEGSLPEDAFVLAGGCAPQPAFSASQQAAAAVRQASLMRPVGRGPLSIKGRFRVASSSPPTQDATAWLTEASRKEPHSKPPVQQSLTPTDLESKDIDLLLRGGARYVLWCWLPRSSRWSEAELLERSTRAVSACRSSDYVALPDLPAAHELAEHWCRGGYGADGVRAERILWFAPLLGSAADDDPADAALRDVLESFASRHSLEELAAGVGPQPGLCYMYPDVRVRDAAAAVGLSCLGDLDSHPLLGSLSNAKSFLHPCLDGSTHSLRDTDLGPDVIGPRGFCCHSAAELRRAWRGLRAAHPNMPLVIKPSGGTGGAGVVLDASRADVERVAADMEFVDGKGGGGGSTIVEEMVGTGTRCSPTVYMVGARLAVVADQLLSPNGTVNLGNASPSTRVPATAHVAMARACTLLGRHLGLRGQWGADFVLDRLGRPIIVDLNMGRPNGSLSYYCWRSRQVPPAVSRDAECSDSRILALIATTYHSTFGSELSLSALETRLRKAGLLWDTARGHGVVLAQYLPGDGGTVLIASWDGMPAAEKIFATFREHNW